MSTGILKCVADVLRNDVVSMPSSGFPDMNAGSYTASGVPTYVYTCLKDIWLTAAVASATSQDKWNKTIVDKYGTGQSGSRTIDVCGYRIIDQDESPHGVGPKSNTPGAEFAEIYVYLKEPGDISQEDENRLSNASMRIRRLIDYNYATNTVHRPEITITDNSILASDDVKVYWQGTISNNDKSAYDLYYAFYTRIYQ